jgi:hypothetical protein
MNSTVTATYAKIHLGELLNRAGFKNEKIFIKKNNNIIAMLAPVHDNTENPSNNIVAKFAGSIDITDKEAEDWTDEIISRRKKSKHWSK